MEILVVLECRTPNERAEQSVPHRVTRILRYIRVFSLWCTDFSSWAYLRYEQVLLGLSSSERMMICTNLSNTQHTSIYHTSVLQVSFEKSTASAHKTLTNLESRAITPCIYWLALYILHTILVDSIIVLFRRRVMTLGLGLASLPAFRHSLQTTECNAAL